MAAKPPDAFLSYTRFDDVHDGGAISEFCRRLTSAVRAVTGVPFGIFQDVEGIGVGEHWPGKLDEMLNEARFFIPILTPSYFTSTPCRDELEKFLRAEAGRQRNDLVLPIYIETDLLEDEDLRAADPLASTLHERQRQDWRELRFESFDAANVRRTLEHLARNIAKARRRPMPQAEEETPKCAEGEGRRRAEEAARHRVAEEQRQRAGQVEAKRRTEKAKEKPSPKGLEPGTVFRDVDASWCPEMVVIPPGEFMMGSSEAEREWAIEQGGRRDWVEYEKPQHLVKMSSPLAVGRYPLTFDEYDHCARTTGREQPRDEDWGRGRSPVINVSWEEAKAYVEWLAAETGQTYRLLSEAEWEYACRAGTTTRYWWGNEIAPESANYGGIVGRTSEVGSYPANPFGLCDMHGNVWEWVEDRWHYSYEGAPEDGSAWITGNEGRRVLRGGSWNNHPRILRSAYRFGNYYFLGKFENGFRVARTLAAQPAASPGKDTHLSKLEYHNPELAGRATFNYSNNNGIYSIGRDESFFETKWSKASDQSIHLYDDPPSIAGVAEAPKLWSYKSVADLASYDMSSRARIIQEGEHAIPKNRYNKYAVLKALDIKDRTRSDTVDKLTFEFWIITDTT